MASEGRTLNRGESVSSDGLTSGRGSARCVYSGNIAWAFSACLSQEAEVRNRIAVMLQSEGDWPDTAAGARSTSSDHFLGKLRSYICSCSIPNYKITLSLP